MPPAKSIGPHLFTAIGVDPGLQHSGVAVCAIHARGEQLIRGSVIYSKAAPKEGAARVPMAEDDLRRSLEIYEGLVALIEAEGAAWVCVESLSLGMPNVTTMIQQGMAFAAIGAAARQARAQLVTIGPQAVRKMIGVVELPRAPRAKAGAKVRCLGCSRILAREERKCAGCGQKRPPKKSAPKKDPEKPEVRAALERRWPDLSPLELDVLEGRRTHVRDAAAVVLAALEEPAGRMRAHVQQLAAVVQEIQPEIRFASGSSLLSRMSRAADRMVAPEAYGKVDA